jgi:hypothetical protein
LSTSNSSAHILLFSHISEDGENSQTNNTDPSHVQNQPQQQQAPSVLHFDFQYPQENFNVDLESAAAMSSGSCSSDSHGTESEFIFQHNYHAYHTSSAFNNLNLGLHHQRQPFQSPLLPIESHGAGSSTSASDTVLGMGRGFLGGHMDSMSHQYHHLHHQDHHPHQHVFANLDFSSARGTSAHSFSPDLAPAAERHASTTTESYTSVGSGILTNVSGAHATTNIHQSGLFALRHHEIQSGHENFNTHDVSCDVSADDGDGASMNIGKRDLYLFETGGHEQTSHAGTGDNLENYDEEGQMELMLCEAFGSERKMSNIGGTSLLESGRCVDERLSVGEEAVNVATPNVTAAMAASYFQALDYKKSLEHEMNNEQVEEYENDDDSEEEEDGLFLQDEDEQFLTERDKQLSRQQQVGEGLCEDTQSAMSEFSPSPDGGRFSKIAGTLTLEYCSSLTEEANVICEADDLATAKHFKERVKGEVNLNKQCTPIVSSSGTPATDSRVLEVKSGAVTGTPPVGRTEKDIRGRPKKNKKLKVEDMPTLPTAPARTHTTINAGNTECKSNSKKQSYDFEISSTLSPRERRYPNRNRRGTGYFSPFQEASGFSTDSAPLSHFGHSSLASLSSTYGLQRHLPESHPSPSPPIAIVKELIEYDEDLSDRSSLGQPEHEDDGDVMSDEAWKPSSGEDKYEDDDDEMSVSDSSGSEFGVVTGTDSKGRGRSTGRGSRQSIRRGRKGEKGVSSISSSPAPMLLDFKDQDDGRSSSLPSTGRSRKSTSRKHRATTKTKKSPRSPSSKTIKPRRKTNIKTITSKNTNNSSAGSSSSSIMTSALSTASNLHLLKSSFLMHRSISTESLVSNTSQSSVTSTYLDSDSAVGSPSVVSKATLRRRRSTKTYPCKSCDRVFTRSDALAVHSYSHLSYDERPFPCEHW